MLLAVAGCASINAAHAPSIDGSIEESAWSAAETYAIPTGGTVRLLRSADQLYIAISAIETGFPTVFVGDENAISVLHASAAQASVRYLRSGSTWTPVAPGFEYTLRQDPDGSQASREARQAFLLNNGWLSTSDRSHGPNREFLVKLDPTRRYLAISILGIPSMKVHGWPANARDDTRNLVLLQGEVPSELKFSPDSWLPIGQ